MIILHGGVIIPNSENIILDDKVIVPSGEVFILDDEVMILHREMILLDLENSVQCSPYTGTEVFFIHRDVPNIYTA